MQRKQADKSSIPWPSWMLRYVSSGNERAFDDLIWSVGGSPPYGGVSWKEAEAVYKLLEEYRGPGEASANAYDTLMGLIRGKADALRAVEVFRLHDRISSNSETYEDRDLTQGEQLALAAAHQGLQTYFQLLRAGLAYRNGEIPEAARQTSAALTVLQALILKDPVYTDQLMKAAKNSVSFAALDGDFAFARTVDAQMQAFGGGEVLSDIRSMLGPAPVFGSTEMVLQHAADYLEHNNPVAALEWHVEAERRLREAGDEKSLGGLLGDKAVAFRRVGNIRRAIETNREAIQVSRKTGDLLNLSRWSANLGALLMQAGDAAGAEECFREGLQTAVRTGQVDQVSVAVGNWATLLASRERFAEAIEEIEKAGKAESSPVVKDVLRSNRSVIYGSWAQCLRREGQAREALKMLDKAIALVDPNDDEELAYAASCHVHKAPLYEQLNNVQEASRALSEAAELYRRLNQPAKAKEIEAVRAKLAGRGLDIR
jgi:tetratricopeptide (TPR) repeat protein